MDRKIRAVIFGIGTTGKHVVRYIVDKGVDVVGAVDIDPGLVGRDVGEAAGIAPLGVLIEDNARAVMERTRPDVAILGTCTTVEDVYDDIRVCVEAGANVITSSEDCYYYKRTRPDLGEELDRLAREHGVTILATGIQDVFWSNLCGVIAAACHRITKISGENYSICDNLGVPSNRKYGVGSTLEEFEAANTGEHEPHISAFLLTLYDIAKRLELTVTEEISKVLPLVSEQDLYCPAYKETVRAGLVIGTSYYSELRTAEGITLTANFSGKLAENGQGGIDRWVIEGEPDLVVTVDDLMGHLTTSSGQICRVPDVLNAPAGFLTVADFDAPRFYARPLNEYVR